MPLSTTIVLTKTASANQTALSTATPWVPLNQYQSPFNVSVAIDGSAAVSARYTVEHTFQDVMDPNVSASPFPHPDINATVVSKIDGNYAFPVRAVRFVLVSAPASTNATFHVNQTGI